MTSMYSSREDMLSHQIMDAAIICIANKGIEKTRIGDIAKELGIARQTIYNYFSSKNALFDAMFSREAVSLASSIAEHIKQYDSLEDKLTQAFLNAIESFPNHPVLMHVITSGGSYLQEMGISRETMQAFGELVLADIFADNPALQRQSQEISELLSRNIVSFIALPDQNPRTKDELEQFFRRRLLPGLGFNITAVN